MADDRIRIAAPKEIREAFEMRARNEGLTLTEAGTRALKAYIGLPLQKVEPRQLKARQLNNGARKKILELANELEWGIVQRTRTRDFRDFPDFGVDMAERLRLILG